VAVPVKFRDRPDGEASRAVGEGGRVREKSERKKHSGRHEGVCAKEFGSTRDQTSKSQKKFGPFLDLCVSSLRRGHANLLCIVPILSDVSE
jgi:hypothetical protein